MPGKGQRADVATDKVDAGESARLPQPTAGMREHHVGTIDANKRHPCDPPDRQRYATRPAAQLENRPLRLTGQSLPEADILAPQRLRILPVVELRVVIPAVPAFGLRRSDLGTRPRTMRR